MQNAWTLIQQVYGSLVAAVSLNTRSTSKLNVVISAIALHSSLACAASPVDEGQNLDNDEINA